MCYLGGGIGHRGVGVSLDTFRVHASRLNQRPRNSCTMAEEEQDSGLADKLEDVDDDGSDPDCEDLTDEVEDVTTGLEDGEDGEEGSEEDIDLDEQREDDSESECNKDESDEAGRLRDDG